MSTAFILYIFDAIDGQLITEASEYETARYLAMVEAMEPDIQYYGRVDGSEFGFPGRSIHMAKFDHLTR